MDEYLKPKEIAEILHCSERHVYARCMGMLKSEIGSNLNWISLRLLGTIVGDPKAPRFWV